MYDIGSSNPLYKVLVGEHQIKQEGDETYLPFSIETTRLTTELGASYNSYVKRGAEEEEKKEGKSRRGD